MPDILCSVKKKETQTTEKWCATTSQTVKEKGEYPILLTCYIILGMG